ncbi:MAG TPA: cytochrome c [Bellilinea sp.]|nr:cytochrome c [Bellilinea sp.]
MKKLLSFSLVLILLMLALAACASSPKATPPPAGTTPTSADADAGAKVFASRCQRCHATTPSTDQVSMAGLFYGGPVLPGGVDYGGKLPNGQEITDENVAAWIHDGGTGKIGRMPGFGLNDIDMANLIAFLKTLK